MRPIFTRRNVLPLAAAGCIFFSEGLLLAQRPPSTSVGRRVEKLNRQAEDYEREASSRGEKKDDSEERRRRGIAVEVKEDFGRLQSTYNEIVVAMKAGQTLDNDFTAEALDAIHKSASRLRDNLVLPRIDEKEKHSKKQDVGDSKNLTKSLTLLCTHISNFVTNPLFETSGVLDVNLTFKASRDLNDIIELSDNLKKKTKRK